MTPYGTMSLDELINALKERPQNDFIRFDFCNFSPGEVESYRGYYDHLAILPDEGHQTVEGLLKILESAVGAIFEGYKGGNYQMSRESPIWVAFHGESGGTAIRKIAECDYMTVIRTEWVA